jgi:hypothetical protein
MAWCAGGRAIVTEADELWVSTTSLAARYFGIARHVTVMPNQLDDRLWDVPMASLAKLLENLHPFAGDFGAIERNTGHVAPGMSRVRHGFQVSPGKARPSRFFSARARRSETVGFIRRPH